MERFLVIGDHMVDTLDVKSATVDRTSIQLQTIDLLGKIKNTYAFENVGEAIKALAELTSFMNKKHIVEKIKERY